MAVTTLGLQVAAEGRKARARGAGENVVSIGSHLPNGGALDKAKGGGLTEAFVEALPVKYATKNRR